MNRCSDYKDSGIEWIGKIPTHWQQNRLGVLGVFSSSGIDKKSLEEERQVKMINYTTLVKNRTHTFSLADTSDYMVTTASERNISEHSVGVGDLIFLPSSETFEDLGLSSVVVFDEPQVVYSYHVVRFRFKKEFDLGFKKYLCNHHGILNQFSSKGKGTTRKILTRDSFKDTKVVFPPINEQTLISEYLDKKTSQIDSLIEKIQQKIELLKEQRTSLINQCVTKGLNPDVEMKESGVEWIGKIPVGWDVKKIKHGFYVKGRIGWKGLKSSEFLSEGFSYLVTGTDFKNGKVDWKGCYHIDKDRYEEDPYIQLRKNDLLITKDGSIGKLAIVDELDKPACLNSGIFVVRSINRDFTTKYLYWVLMSNIFAQFNDYTSYGSTIQHLYQNIFVEFSFGFPVMEEQILISNYLDKKTSQIDSLIEKETKRIELLKEYRQSLISNVVTGKMRITEEMI